MSFDTPDRGAAFPRQTGRRDVLVIGGGGSGVLFAANLSRQDSDLRVRVIEGRHLLGCGIACSTTDPDHLLKTRICNKGSFPEDEGAFPALAAGSARWHALCHGSFNGRATCGS